MKLVWRLLIGLMLLVVTPMVMAAGVSAPSAKWYKLDPVQKYQADYTLKPGESKNLDIASGVPIIVGFKTDMTEKQLARNELKNSNAILLSTPDGARSVSSWDKGELGSFEPASGKIALKLDNQGDIPLRVVIYAKLLNVAPVPKAAGTKAPSAKWYKLDADKIYQADYTLKPGESKSLDITASGSSIKVGFESDVTPDQSAKLEKEGVKEAIKLSTRDGKESISSTYGGATAFTIKNKKLPVKVQNRTTIPVKVVIYTEAN